jgi:hypothetical protein
MFLQIMQGKVRDAELLKQQMDLWRRDFKDGAVGFLGSTSGFTGDGQFVALARFESEAAAKENSNIPEQNAWWEKFASAFDGEMSFTDCTEVDVFLAGGSDAAGFVQIMRGRAVDPDAMRRDSAEMEKGLSEARPDVIGGIVGWHGDREFTQAVYFVDEESARKGEAEATDSEGAEEWAAMIEGDVSFVDLPDPFYD